MCEVLVDQDSSELTYHAIHKTDSPESCKLLLVTAKLRKHQLWVRTGSANAHSVMDKSDPRCVAVTSTGRVQVNAAISWVIFWLRYRWRCVDKKCRKWYGWVKSHEEIPRDLGKKGRWNHAARTKKPVVTTKKSKEEDDTG